MELLYLYYDCVPPRTASEVVATHLMHSQIIMKFIQHPSTAREVFAAKGVRRILAAAWATTVHQSYDAHGPRMLNSTTLPLLGLYDIKGLENFTEVVDGGGGSYDALAFMIKKSISQAVMNSKSQLAVIAIGPLLLFLQDILKASPDFRAYLLSRGIISSLVSTLDIDGIPQATVGVPARQINVELCAATLMRYLDVPPGYTWTLQALQAGLLRRIITSSVNITTLEGAGKYPDLLGAVLPRSLVSYTVITEMRKDFLELEALARTEEFAHSPLLGHWNALRALVHQRAQVLDAWEASGRLSSLACYNMKCNKVDGRESFRRCSACRTAAYCSRECQRANWIDGHRDECGVLLSAHLTFTEIGLHYHEKNFLRALVHSDYQRLRVQISMATLQFLAQNPDGLFFVGFDYTGINGVQCSVVPMTQLGVGLNIPHWGRLARAGGRLTLHAVKIDHGAKGTNTLFPLRATTSQFYDGLVGLAGGIRGLQPAQVEALVRELIETTDKENTEIH
ncbi:hypothetical protein B0H16DRAFT_1689439 [Mycena metata]|uniref:phytol kinase n=1 Tax=Mycena metata TaxID=1033252 RepID=A0AAD7J6F3_9AGAR|nr:hypothetical protein B0H16DRAFT_1689439 [Mycena metata]